MITKFHASLGDTVQVNTFNSFYQIFPICIIFQFATIFIYKVGKPFYEIDTDGKGQASTKKVDAAPVEKAHKSETVATKVEAHKTQD